MFTQEHWRPDGSCDCPLTDVCGECGKPVTDHDLVADWYWCGQCINKHLDEDKSSQAKTPLEVMPVEESL